VQNRPQNQTEKKVRELIKARLKARQERTRAQLELIPGPDLLKEQIRGKLVGLLETNQFQNFERCGNEMIYQTCKNCGQVHELPMNCNLKWCPRCQWRITGRRSAVLRKWAATIDQPKHLVLTQRNFPVLTKKEIKQHKQNLLRMRRSSLFTEVKGGCVSVEITNESRGWHLHSHWLLDVRWMDIREIAKKWGELVGQEFAIVKIKDLRGAEYVHEVAKYVVEANSMANWPAEQILELVTASRGTRFFFQFGSLLAQGKRIKAEINMEKPESEPCECGAKAWLYESEQQSVINQIRREARR
jgi:hypothetical protein